MGTRPPFKRNKNFPGEQSQGCTTILFKVKDKTDNRAFILVLDGFGIGSAPDAADFGDPGADTLGHIAEACLNEDRERTSGNRGALKVPFMESLGLGEAARMATGRLPAGLSGSQPRGRYAACREISHGKDTSSGHWELAGSPVLFDWDYFPEKPSFPPLLVEKLVREAKLPGILGNCHASGTEIIEDLGEEHLTSGKPICYTSADSVFQVAAHEESFGLDRLYRFCELARKSIDESGLRIGRVIARPFQGRPGNFDRTTNRRDYSLPPPGSTLLDLLSGEGRQVRGLGKISEIFAGRGLTDSFKAPGNDGIFRLFKASLKETAPGSLTFANFVDFDMLYGHRRDIAGYASALEVLDRRLAGIATGLRPGDLLVITSDHGCDPDFTGSNHTREYVPALISGPLVRPGNAGIRETFADIGQTVASHLGVAPLEYGTAIAIY